MPEGTEQVKSPEQEIDELHEDLYNDFRQTWDSKDRLDKLARIVELALTALKRVKELEHEKDMDNFNAAMHSELHTSSTESSKEESQS